MKTVRRIRKGRVLGALLVLFLIIFIMVRLISSLQTVSHKSSLERETPENLQVEAQEEIVVPDKYTIILDPGHGGKDGGAVGINGTIEKDVTLITAQRIKDLLEPYDMNVELTRSDDIFVGLDDRIQIAEEAQADLFISIHYDGFESADVHGMTSYYYHERDEQIAQLFHDEIKSKQIEIKDRGVLIGNYYVLRENEIPSILLELGYMTNLNNEMLMNSDDFQGKVSEAVVSAIVQHYEENK